MSGEFKHRCDAYELVTLPGVSFCRKFGARAVHEKLQELTRLKEERDTFQRVAKVQDEKAHRWLEELTGAQRALAAAQARERLLREALTALVACGMPARARELELRPERMDVVVAKIDAALAAPTGDEALRDLLEKAALLAAENSPPMSPGEVATAILRGEK